MLPMQRQVRVVAPMPPPSRLIYIRRNPFLRVGGGKRQKTEGGGGGDIKQLTAQTSSPPPSRTQEIADPTLTPGSGVYDSP